MSYTTIHQCAGDPAFNNRVTACCAQEGADNPVQAADAMRWEVATATDIAAAYESAVLNENPNPGGDPAVITDQMILSVVQPNLPAVLARIQGGTS